MMTHQEWLKNRERMLLLVRSEFDSPKPIYPLSVLTEYLMEEMLRDYHSKALKEVQDEIEKIEGCLSQPASPTDNG